MTEAGYAVFWPRWVVQKTIFGKQQPDVQRMAAGLLFIAFDGADAHQWHIVRDLCGETTRFIGGEFPTRIPDAALQPLRNRGADITGLMPLPGGDGTEPEYRAGDTVMVTGLAEEPFVARVSWADRKGARVVPTLAAFGLFRELYVPHAAGMLRKVGKQPALTMPQYGWRGRQRNNALLPA